MAEVPPKKYFCLEKGCRMFPKNKSKSSNAKRLSQKQREEIAGYIFLMPWIIGFLAFTAGPMVSSLYFSFSKTDMLTPTKFIGLGNYSRLFSFNEAVSLFWKTLWNTGYYVFLSVPLSVIVGLLIAMLLNQKIIGRGIFRTIYYLPAVVSGVAVCILWMWIFNPNFGILNHILSSLHIPGPRWLFSERWSKPALIIMSLWGMGGGMLIYLGGLQGIPTQLYESAEIDGAGRWIKFFKVTLPMLSPTIFFVLVTGIIGSFQVFVASYVMTRGGPNNSTMMYVLYLYNLAFEQYRMGYACALAWVYFGIIMGFIILIFKSSSAWLYYESGILKGKK